jgi:ABC-2 type transport system permease protein
MPASGSRDTAAPRTSACAAYAAFAAAGFLRHATYRQAMVAAIVTNSVFGFLRAAVLLAAAGASAGAIAGYDEARLAAFVWAGQGLIGVVLIWAPTELADRIRAGDVVADLLRPIDLLWQQLASDLGRAGLAVFTRFAAPVVVGALAFGLYAPRRPATYALFAASVLLATIVCFGCRYLVNAAAYWLLDARGPQVAWTLASGVLGGLYFPIWFLPRALALGLVLATPFPSVIQLPLDILVERGSPAEQAALLAVQAGWAVAMLGLCRFIQRRGERTLVVQGG